MTDLPKPFGVPLPKSSGELITVLAHYHRAEIARMAGWRDRIDRTTNWAITVIAAMLSVSLSTSNAHHGVLLFAMLLVGLLLNIEARRYRFFDVYRNRVRHLERYYYAQLFAPGEDFYGAWTIELGKDLRHPVFNVRFIDAVGRRLRRNYIWMFFILLAAWLLKIGAPEQLNASSSADATLKLHEVVANAAVGPLSGIIVLTLVATTYLILMLLTANSYRVDAGHADGKVHV